MLVMITFPLVSAEYLQLAARAAQLRLLLFPGDSPGMSLGWYVAVMYLKLFWNLLIK
jgi:hypothetical protein